MVESSGGCELSVRQHDFRRKPGCSVIIDPPPLLVAMALLPFPTRNLRRAFSQNGAVVAKPEPMVES